MSAKINLFSSLLIGLACWSHSFAADSILFGNKLIEGFGRKLAYYEVADTEKEFLHSVELGKRVSSLELSLNKKFILVKADESGNSEFFGIDLETRSIIFKSPIFQDVVDYYWMSNCHFAVLQNNKEHGGTVQVNPLPSPVAKKYKIDCDDKDISLDQVPQDEAPKRLIKMDEANLWAYYSNGSREVVSWLSDGQFYDFVIGKNDKAYFKESSAVGKIFEADFSKKKMNEFYKADGVFKLDHKDRLIVLDQVTKKLGVIGSGKFTALLEQSVVAFILDQEGKAVYARLENGQYRYIKL